MKIEKNSKWKVKKIMSFMIMGSHKNVNTKDSISASKDKE